MSKVTLPSLQQMKQERRKIVAVVAWDFQIAQIVDRIGVEIVSVGDSVGQHLWGQPSPLDVTLEEMIIVCKAVRRGVTRALVSCDFPPGVADPRHARRRSMRHDAWRTKEAPISSKSTARPAAREAVTAIAQPAFLCLRRWSRRRTRSSGRRESARSGGRGTDRFQAFGTEAGAAVAGAVDHSGARRAWRRPMARRTPAHGARGHRLRRQQPRHPVDTYANVARIAFVALTAYAGDVRAGRQIRGAKP